jgi:hypothetical protein
MFNNVENGNRSSIKDLLNAGAVVRLLTPLARTRILTNSAAKFEYPSAQIAQVYCFFFARLFKAG